MAIRAIDMTIAGAVDVAPTLDELIAAVVRTARPGDVVITLGAGSIGSVPERLIEALGGRPDRDRAVAAAVGRQPAAGRTRPAPAADDSKEESS